jgi:hypothetical protein
MTRQQAEALLTLKFGWWTIAPAPYEKGLALELSPFPNAPPVFAVAGLTLDARGVISTHRFQLVQLNTDSWAWYGMDVSGLPDREMEIVRPQALTQGNER